MGFRLKKTEVLSCKTADEVRKPAIRLKGFGGTESEREDKAARKRKIKEKVLGGEATPFRWCIGRIKANGLIRRVNGQHGSEVFLELTPEEWEKVVFPIVIIWEEYECDEMRDLPNLFEQFDPIWSNRDAKDIMGAHLGIHDDLRNAISRHVAVKIATGLIWHRQAIEGLKTDSSSKFEIIHENHDMGSFLTWCGSFLQKGKTEEMHSVPVVAAMYHTSKDGDEAARGFWRRVTSGKAPLDADTVEYKLAEFLELCQDKQAEWPRSVSKNFRAGTVRPSDLDVFATCLRSFSAWQKGTKVAEVFTSGKGKKAKEITEMFSKVSQTA